MAMDAIRMEEDRAIHKKAATAKRRRFSTSCVSLEKSATHFPFASDTTIIMGIRLASKYKVVCVATLAVEFVFTGVKPNTME